MEFEQISKIMSGKKPFLFVRHKMLRVLKRDTAGDTNNFTDIGDCYVSPPLATINLMRSLRPDLLTKAMF